MIITGDSKKFAAWVLNRHKDPNGKWCKGEKESRHPKCWHCDTCLYAKCVNEDDDFGDKI